MLNRENVRALGERARAANNDLVTAIENSTRCGRRARAGVVGHENKARWSRLADFARPTGRVQGATGGLV